MADRATARTAHASPRELARNVRVLASTALRRVEEDPVRLGVHAVRRLPRRMREPFARGLVAAARASRNPVTASLGHTLADHPDEARRALLDHPSAVTTRVGSELAVELGVALPPGSPVGARARERWQAGDLGSAVALLRAEGSRTTTRQAGRLESERRTYAAGFRLDARPGPRAVARPGPSAVAEGARVLHLLTNSLPRTQSGYALRSHAILRAQRGAGIDARAVTRVGYPVIVGLPWAAGRDTVDGVAYDRLLPAALAPTPEGRLHQGVDLLLDEVDRFGPSVLHTTTHFVNALVVEAAARSRGLPWVYEMRGQLERTWVAGRPPEQRTAALASERYRTWAAKEIEMAQEADHVVVLSEVLRRHVVEAGVPAERVTVVPNAVDDALLAGGDTSPEQARSLVGLPTDGFWVGTVSSLVGYEGLDTLLRAVAALRDDGLDVRCAVVGDGAARPGLVRLAAGLGLGEHAVFPGRVDRRTAPDWHRALDVFVVPRRDTEVTRTVSPLKPVEAMAVGRPVVASDLPALAEVVREGGTGLLVRPEDPEDLAGRLRELYADPAARAALGTRGRELAATRTWQAMARRYSSIYESLGVRA